MPSAPDERLFLNRLESIYRANPAGMGLVVDRTLVEVNEKLCEMTGYSREEMLGRSSRFLYVSDEEYQTMVETGFSQLEAAGSAALVTRWKRKDGTTFDVLVGSSPPDLNDRGSGITFTALDISERKEAERALREHEETLHALLNATTDLVFLVSATGALLAANEAFARTVGAQRGGDLVGQVI